MAVALIGALVVLTVIMGLTPQNTSVHTNGNLLVVFGLTQITSAWSFVLVYFFTMLSLGAVIVRRLFRFRVSDYAFYLNHIGLWLFLFSAGAGAADVRRYVMHVHEGEIEWRVFNNRGEILDLPIAIELNDFFIEYYSHDMSRPVPKRFVSDINIYSEDGKQAHTLLEVNKPYKMGHWMLYQYGYDNNAGNMSKYSSIELVYDPWVMAVYAGIILLSCGSVCMLWTGKKRKEEYHDVE
jgi:cytochrome c biogenesis protein ResB